MLSETHTRPGGRRRIAPHVADALRERKAATPPALPEPADSEAARQFLTSWTPTLLKCRADHPLGRGPKRRTVWVGKPHNRILFEVPFNCEPTGRILTDPEHVDRENGCFPARCDDPECVDYLGRRYITEYRVIAPGQKPGAVPPPAPENPVPPST